MFELTVEDHFAAAHYLSHYQGKCERLHGHNWNVQITIRGEQLDKAGLLMDFGLLKSSLRDVLAVLDHRLLNELDHFQGASVSSEKIAIFIHEQLAPRIHEHGAVLCRVSVWESPSACATYIPE